ncbi:MAG TPA: Ig-like domain-containing protein, partial [Verrucomicrobiae bacterium]|nr:Ig-like domain-containing protein [Verrucomicrobiae bacterium]
FIIGDLESPAEVLSLSVASTFTNVIPVTSVVFGGGGSNRFVTITPGPNLPGVSRITISVKDPQGGVAETSFNVSITSENTAPEISHILDAVVNEDASTGEIPFLVADQKTPAGELLVTGHAGNTSLVPDAGFVFGGSGISRTLRIIPATNQFGSSTITIGVSDGQITTFTNFTLTVLPVNDSPLVRLITPAEGASFIASESVIIEADVDDIDGQITRVDFIANGSRIGSLTARPYRLVWTNTSAGDYSIAAVATDDAGATVGSALVHIQVKPSPPSLRITDLSEGIILFWPAAAADFVLEAASDLRSGNWSAIEQTPTVSKGEYSLKVDSLTGARFFRLRRP